MSKAITKGEPQARRNRVAEALGRMDVRASPGPSPAEQQVAARLAARAAPPLAPATATPTPVEPAAAAAAAAETIKHLTLYLNKGAWAQLHGLAVRLDQRPHSLLIRALNDLFVAEGLEPLAHDRRKGMSS
jgi:hypothetical protein